MFGKKSKLTVVLFLATVLLSGCANNKMPDLSNKNSSSKVDQDKQPTVAIALARGKILQSSGLITIPVVLKNIGSNSTVISSKNFTLEVQGHKFNTFNAPGEASDYHQDFDSNRIWNNTLSFYLGTTLTPKQLQHVKLFYQMDNGKEIQAKVLTTSTNQNNIRSNLNNHMKSIGTYYSDITSFVKKNKEGEDISLKDSFSDPDYDKFKTWIVVPKKDPHNIIIKVLNQSNTDISISFNNIELVDRNNVETRVAPSYRNYFLIIPHGKYAMASVPMESKLDVSRKPFSTKVRADDNDFFSTQDAIYPIETVISSNGKDINSLFSLTPKEYKKCNISWSKPVLDFENNKLSVTVELKDYFALHAKAKAFSLVGVNKDKTIGDKEYCCKLSPAKITKSDPTDMILSFKDLSLLKTYSNIELRYKNSKIMQIK